jgi:hypothetical protein
MKLDELPRLERDLLREFKRSYSTCGSVLPVPDDSDTLAWLSLMQHYGAPTRLLDWTYSPFVAAFFALNALLGARDKQVAAVWALSFTPLRDPYKMFPFSNVQTIMDHFETYRDGPSFDAIFVRSNEPLTFVGAVNPWHLHGRLKIQQGLFLCPGNIQYTFEQNLQQNLTRPGIQVDDCRKFLLPRSLLEQGFAGLHRVNINEETLFPGMDGYGRRLRHHAKYLSTLPISRMTKA